MRRFFELFDDVSIPGRWHVGEICADDGTEPRLRAGIGFANNRCNSDEPLLDAGIHREQALLTGKVTKTGIPLEYFLTSFAVPIASEKLARAISAMAASDVQCLPVRIEGHTGFQAVNALRVADCLDERKSEFIKWTEKDHRADLAGQYRQVTKLRLDTERIPENAKIFRVKGWLIALIVSEEVKKTMERVGCLGAKFDEVTD